MEFAFKKKNYPKDIPSNPQKIYKKKWKSWGDFLGTGRVSNRLKLFRPFVEAKKYAQSLKLKGQSGWFLHTKSKNFPQDLPYGVSSVYKEEWKGWPDFLGAVKNSNSKKSQP